jgi:hypothetical protein
LSPEALVAALEVPAAARVDQRVPKKALVEHGAPTAADKRRINEGVEEVLWFAALKPTTIGVPAFRDPNRDYLEVAVLRARLRAEAQGDRLTTLIHRAIPYPLILIATQGDALTVSLGHKRHSQSEAGATVLDGDLLVASPDAGQHPTVGEEFVSAMALVRQPRTDLLVLYQGWMDTVTALRAAQVTGVFAVASSPEMAAARRMALAECERLEAQMAGLRAAATKERQVARQVELNLEIKRVEAEHSAARARL